MADNPLTAIADFLGASLLGIPTSTSRQRWEEDRQLQRRFVEAQIANLGLAPDELALQREALGLRGREVSVGERAQTLAEAMQGPEIARIGALTRNMEAEAALREQELADLQNPGQSIANLIKGVYEGLGMELPPELGGPEMQGPPAPDSSASPVMGAATQAVQQMLARAGSMPAIPVLEGLTGKEMTGVGLASGRMVPTGGFPGSATRELGLALEGLPMSAREQVMDAFRAPLERIRSSIGQFAGATDADLQTMLRQATESAAQSALSLARDIQTKRDADMAWIGKNRGFISRSYPQLTGTDADLYRILGQRELEQLRRVQDAENAYRASGQFRRDK